jgi:hypothetical protein
MALSMDPLKLSGAVPNKRGWWAWAIVGAGGGGSGGGLLLGGGFSPSLLGAVGPLDVGGVWVCVGLERPNEMAHGSGGDMGYFLLDTGGVGTCLVFGEGCLEIQESELSCNWGVPGKLASLSVAEVIAYSADRSNSSILAVSFSDLLLLSSLSEPCGSSVSDALEPLKCTI